MTHHDPRPIFLEGHDITFPKHERYPSNYSPVFENLDDVRTVIPLPDGDYLERPTETVINHLRDDDPRIDVVHFSDQYDLQKALADKLDEDFQGEDVIAIRAIEASLDGLVTSDTMDVHDIRDILRMGEMRNRGRVNLAGFPPQTPGSAVGTRETRIHHRVEQFATQTDIFRKHSVGLADGVEKIFPVVLVYNASKIHPAAGNYGWELPSDEAERASVILKAYVLDTQIHRTQGL